MPKGVLEGIRVLDFSRFFAGPYCGMILADMGAEVIRVERPGGEIDRAMGPFTPNGNNLVSGMILLRNKKAITLNLLSDKGIRLLTELVKHSDVVLHNFTPDSKEAKILDYRALKKMNPNVILAALTAFGQNGPYASRPGFDVVAQALSGTMSFTGFPGSPPGRAAVGYVDFGSALYTALGIMFALYHREKTRMGQMVDVALLDTATSFLVSMGVAAEVKLSNFVRQQIGNCSFYCFNDTFKTKDGWIFVAMVSNPLWRRFLKAVGKGEMADDPRFKDDMARFQNRELIHSIIDGWMLERPTDEVVQILLSSRVPCGRVNSTAQMVNDPQLKARQMIVDVEYPEVGKVPLPGIVVKLSETPGEIRTRAPVLGEHNEEVYCRLLGFSKDDIMDM